MTPSTTSCTPSVVQQPTEVQRPLAATMQAVRKHLEAPLNKLENGAVHLEQDVQEKFSKLFGESVSEVGDGEGADGSGEGG